MPKNIFVYPCDSFVGRSVSKAFAAAGHAVSGLALTGNNAPPSVSTVIRADDSDVTTAQKQLLLTADVVVYDLLGNERAARDAVVQLTQQPYGGREVVFIAVSSPLVWAATRPNPGALFASATGSGSALGGATGEWGAGAEGGAAAGGGGEGEEAPWAGARGTTGGGSGAGTGSGDGEEAAGAAAAAAGGGEAGDGAVPLADAVAIAALFGAPVEHVLARSASTPKAAPTFKAPEDVPRRLPAAPARAALAVEQLVMRAGRKGRLRTAVVCPGLLYGEGEDDLGFCNAFKAAWTWQCLPTRPNSEPPGPRLLVYGRGTNVLPTLHVADLAAYIMTLAGLPPPRAPAAPAAAAAGSSALAPAATPAQTVGGAAAGGGGSVLSGGAAAGATSASSWSVSGWSSGGYYLVTDGSRCTQAELVTAIAASMGLGTEEGAIEYVPEADLHLHPPALRSRMLLDLALATTPLPALLAPAAPSPASAPSPSPTTTATSAAPAAPLFFTLSRPGGLPAHLADVAAEFRSARTLTSLRILVTGPPLSGKTHLSRRLAARYGLAYISVPLLLAAAGDAAVAAAAGLNPAMDPALLRAAQLEVAAGPAPPSGKEQKEREREKDKDKEAPNPGWLPTGGRVSAKTLGALLGSALADPRCAARCRGFVLDGFPRSAAQARGAFYGLQVDEAAAVALAAEQSHATIKGHKSHKNDRSMGLGASPSTPKLEGSRGGGSPGPAAAAAAAPPAPDFAAIAAAANMPQGGGAADLLEVPPAMKLVPNALTAPTHVIELEVGEEELRARLAALTAAAEAEVTRVTGEASTASDSDRKAPGGGTPVKRTPGGGGPAGGKSAAGSGLVSRDVLLAAALGHNGEAGFGRRLTAYGNWRAEDAADLRARVAAAEAAWEAECGRREAERARAAAEASTLKAKRRRARAAAAAAAAGVGGGTTTVTINGEDDGGDDVAAGNDVGAAAAAPPPPPPELPQHGGLIALSLGAGGATHIRLTNPNGPEGPMVTISVQPPPAAALMAAGPAAAASGAAGPTSIASTVAAAATAALAAAAPLPPPALPSLERSLEALLGPPHNLSGFPEPGPTPPAAAALPLLPTEAAAAAAAAAADGKADPRTPRPGSDPAGLAAGGPSGAVSAAAAAAAVIAQAAAAGGAAAAAVEAGTDASYVHRWRGARGAAVRRYLLRHVVPVVTAALAEVAVARTGGSPPGSAVATAPVAAAATASGGGGSFTDAATSSQTGPSAPSSAPGTPGSLTGAALGLGPGASGKEALLHVARALAAAAAEAEAAFVDPYSDPSYGIQLAKIDAKKAREAARAAVAAAKAEREAAARQQQLQQAAKEEEQ